MAHQFYGMILVTLVALWTLIAALVVVGHVSIYLKKFFFLIFREFIFFGNLMMALIALCAFTGSQWV